MKRSFLYLNMPLDLLVVFSIFNGIRPALGSEWTKSPPTSENISEDFRVSPETGNIANPIVFTDTGGLRGFTMKTKSNKSIAAFQGIPFAQPPIRDLRFKDPVRNKGWTGIRNAIAQSPECIQLDLMRLNGVHGEEDCLFLNVYTPHESLELKLALPVLIFIHGGAFQWGAGGIYGPAYLLDEQVVLVTFNYRLGPFGFLSTGDDSCPGNQGMKDQMMVMQWVQANIKAFGGDPNSVTIFGHSSGGGSVQHHFVSPLSRGLFHRGISGSGSSMCTWSIAENSTTIANKLGGLFGCGGSTDEMVECLRKMDANQLALAHLNFTDKYGNPPLFYGPVVEHNHPGAFLIETPEESYKNNRAAKVPWITGFTTNEMSFRIALTFSDATNVALLNTKWNEIAPNWLSIHNGTENDVEIVKKIRKFYFGWKPVTYETRHNLVDLFGDRVFYECGLEAMRYHSLYTDQPVYAYQFSYQGKYSIIEYYGQDPKDWGVAHSDELIYLFNMTDFNFTLQPEDVEELRMSRMLTGMWTNFATYGHPLLNSKDGSGREDIWKPIPTSTSLFSPLRFLDLNINPKMIDDPYVERYNFWRNLRLVD